MRDNVLRSVVLAAAFTALIIVGALLSFPSPWNPAVPFTLATLFVVLAGVLLGPWAGAASVAAYLFLGLVGLPVFAGGTGGPQVFVGPTGGFLLGYLLAALAGGLVVRAGKGALWALVVGVAVASAVIYVPGIPLMQRWFASNREGWTWAATMAAVAPYFVGDAVKAVAAVLLARALAGRLGAAGRGA